MCDNTKTANECLSCGDSTGLRKLTPTSFICTTCSDALGLEPAAQFVNEAEWLVECLNEVRRELHELEFEDGLSERGHARVKRAMVFTNHVSNRYGESLVLVAGA